MLPPLSMLSLRPASMSPLLSKSALSLRAASRPAARVPLPSSRLAVSSRSWPARMLPPLLAISPAASFRLPAVVISPCWLFRPSERRMSLRVLLRMTPWRLSSRVPSSFRLPAARAPPRLSVWRLLMSALRARMVPWRLQKWQLEYFFQSIGFTPFQGRTYRVWLPAAYCTI